MSRHHRQSYRNNRNAETANGERMKRKEMDFVVRHRTANDGVNWAIHDKRHSVGKSNKDYYEKKSTDGVANEH